MSKGMSDKNSGKESGIRLSKEKIINIIKWTVFVVVTMIIWYRMHVYKISEYPFEMQIDEFGIGYDAWSLLHYGVDRWLYKFPVYLNNYGRGSSLAYTLLCMASMAFWGNTSVAAIRFPAIVVSLLSMILVFLLVRRIEKKWLPFAAAILFNVLPYYTMQSRIALDCNLMMCGMLLVMYGMLIALEKDDCKAYALAGVLCGVSLYTYIVSWVVVPVMVAGFVVYTIWIKKMNIKKLFSLGVPMAILASPLMLFEVVNMLGMDSIVLGPVTIPRLLIDRGDEVGLHNIWDSVTCFFNTIFYGDGLPVNSIYGFFTMYQISVPIVCFGMIMAVIRMVLAIKNRQVDLVVIVNVLFLAEFALGVSIGSNYGQVGGDGININRINGVYSTLIIYLMLGIYYLVVYFSKLCDKVSVKYNFKSGMLVLKMVPVAVLTCVYMLNFVKWNVYYFEAKVPAQFCFSSPLDEIVDYFGDEFFTRNVHMDANYAQMLLATHMNPYDFNAMELPRDEDENVISWKNMTFNLYGEFGKVDDNALYIVYKEHNEFIEYFEQFGMNKFETLMYICYYN